MSLLITTATYALGTAVLLMAMVWSLWPSGYPYRGNTATVVGGVSSSPPRRHSPNQSPSRR